MYLLHFINFHTQENHKRYGFPKSKIMDYNFGSKFVYGLSNGSMIYDVFVRDLILIT
jgi:hypothetical protein